jgi:signal transduction histidine kinase
MRLLPRSIRWRIQLWHGVLLLAVLIGFGFTAFGLQRNSAYATLDAELRLRTAALSDALQRNARGGRRPPPSGDFNGEFRPKKSPGGPGPRNFRLPEEMTELFSATGEKAFYYVAWARDDVLMGKSAAAPDGVPLPPRGLVDGVRSRNGMREAWHFTPPGECLLAGVSEAVLRNELSRSAAELAGLGGVVLLLGLAGGWWIASRAIAPIRDITSAATRIADGQLSERIPVAETESELGQLAGVLNHTFARLEAAFAEQARFSSDAAHELRTPISVILAQAQLSLSRPRSVEEYQETIGIIQRSAKRMESLSESLLSLAVLDARSEPLELEACDLADLARDQVEHLQPLAREAGLSIDSDLQAAPCQIEPERITQVFANLLSNAVKFTPRGGRITVHTTSESGQAMARVSDNGQGIAASHLPHLFERFYRADASRDRSSGGAGLGLAISRTIALAHGGTLEVTSTVGEGSTFTLSLPSSPRTG